jgi:hypothetical protein
MCVCAWNRNLRSGWKLNLVAVGRSKQQHFAARKAVENVKSQRPSTRIDSFVSLLWYVLQERLVVGMSLFG